MISQALLLLVVGCRLAPFPTDRLDDFDEDGIHKDEDCDDEDPELGNEDPVCGDGIDADCDGTCGDCCFSDEPAIAATDAIGRVEGPGADAPHVGVRIAGGSLLGDEAADLVMSGYELVDEPHDEAVFILDGNFIGDPGLVAGDERFVTVVSAGGERFGQSLLVAGIGGDGLDELLIGAPEADALYSVPGPFLPGSTIELDEYDNILGEAGDQDHSLSWALEFGAGELGGDLSTQPIVAVSGPDYTNGVIGNDSDGAIYVFGVVSSEALLIAGSRGGSFGHAVAADDFDGDGIADLVGSAPRGELSGPPRILGFAGPIVDGQLLVDADDVAVFRAEPGEDGWLMGDALDSSDQDGDGTADLLVSSISMDSGAVHIFLLGEGPQQFMADAWATIELPALKVGLSYGLSGHTDLDKDGIADIVVGVPGTEDGSDNGEGRVYQLRGGDLEGKRVASNDNMLMIKGPAGAASAFGLTVDAHDVDGNGWSDIVAGAPLEGQATLPGAVYVFGNRGF